MILYHGSFLEIKKPDFIHSRLNLDFGRGFYVTPLYEQAAKWCGKQSIVYVMKNLICKFASARRKHCPCCILKGVK